MTNAYAANTAMVYCLLIIETYAKVQLEVSETKDLIHESLVKPASHTSEGVASKFQSISWEKAAPISRNSSDLHKMEGVIFKSID